MQTYTESDVDGKQDLFVPPGEEAPAPAPRAAWAQIRTEYEASGAPSVREIARRHNLSDTAIHRRIRSEGWTRAGLQSPETPAANQSEPSLQTSVQTGEGEEFNWQAHRKCVAVPTQMAIACYWNLKGELVIRQERDWDDERDVVITIGAQHVRALIDRMQAVLSGED